MNTNTTNSENNEITNLLGCLFWGLIIVIDIIQAFAIYAGLAPTMGWFGALLTAGATAWIPLIGTILAIYGAISAWGWEPLAAIALFAGPYIILIPIAIIASLFQRK